MQCAMQGLLPTLLAPACPRPVRRTWPGHAAEPAMWDASCPGPTACTYTCLTSTAPPPPNESAGSSSGCTCSECTCSPPGSTRPRSTAPGQLLLLGAAVLPILEEGTPCCCTSTSCVRASSFGSHCQGGWGRRLYTRASSWLLSSPPPGKPRSSLCSARGGGRRVMCVRARFAFGACPAPCCSCSTCVLPDLWCVLPDGTDP
eukprot:1156847-Pelagomonas_calceolata.AAC.4